jgi:hypothetical protein
MGYDGMGEKAIRPHPNQFYNQPIQENSSGRLGAVFPNFFFFLAT